MYGLKQKVNMSNLIKTRKCFKSKHIKYTYKYLAKDITKALIELCTEKKIEIIIFFFISLI